MSRASTIMLYHLAGPHMSGRGVKLRDLTASEVDEALIAAGQQANGDSTRFLALRPREAARRMLVAVTDQAGLPDIDAVRAASWHRCTLLELEGMAEGAGKAWALDELFTSKDVEVLESIFRRRHDVTVAEVDAIMGKGLQATED